MGTNEEGVETRVTHVPPGEGRSLWVLGELVTYKNLKYYAKYRKGADRAAYDYLYERVDKIETLASQVQR